MVSYKSDSSLRLSHAFHIHALLLVRPLTAYFLAGAFPAWEALAADFAGAFCGPLACEGLGGACLA